MAVSGVICTQCARGRLFDGGSLKLPCRIVDLTFIKTCSGVDLEAQGHRSSSFSSAVTFSQVNHGCARDRSESRAVRNNFVASSWDGILGAGCHVIDDENAVGEVCGVTRCCFGRRGTQ